MLCDTRFKYEANLYIVTNHACTHSYIHARTYIHSCMYRYVHSHMRHTDTLTHPDVHSHTRTNTERT